MLRADRDYFFLALFITLAAMVSQGPLLAQGGGCTYQVQVDKTDFPANGGSGLLTISTMQGCSWTVSRNVNWIMAHDPTSGSGNGTVRFSLMSHQGPARSGQITVNSQVITVSQASGCSYWVDIENHPSSTDFGDQGGWGYFAVNASDRDCPWTMESHADLITVDSPGQWTGSWAPAYRVAPNPTGAYRDGTMTVAGWDFTVRQYSAALAELFLFKEHSGDFFYGQNAVYTLTVRSRESTYSLRQTNKTITVTDTLPEGLSFVSATGPDWTCGCIGQTVTCNRQKPLGPAEQTTITIIVRVELHALPAIENTAHLNYGGDRSPEDNTSRDTVTVKPMRQAFVSVAGSASDTNDCTSERPCRTVGRATAQVASNGEVIILDSTTLDPFMVTKAVQILAPWGVSAQVVVPSGAGVLVNASVSERVVLRGLRIKGLGGTNGVRVSSVGSLLLEDCEITGFTGHGVEFLADGSLELKSTTVGDSVGSGLFVFPANAATVEANDCSFLNNQFGVELRGGAKAVMSNCLANGNTIAGFRAQASVRPVSLTLRECSATDNGIGVSVDGAPWTFAASLDLERCFLVNNTVGLHTSPLPSPVLVSKTNTNVIAGNGTNLDVGLGGTTTSLK